MQTTTTTKRPVLSLIAAVARDGGIGRGNELLWRERADQQRFRALTMGSPVIMGRRTWDSLPARFRPLPGRTNIVVTRNAQWQAEGALRARSLDEALALAAGSGAAKAFVIGGAQLYAEALPRADELQLTEIDAAFDGADAFFPSWDRARFAETARERHVSDSGVAYSFVTYARVGERVDAD
jgi:dihydrofolate reductase